MDTPMARATIILPPDPGTIVSCHGHGDVASASPGAHNACILAGTHPWANGPSCQGTSSQNF